MNIKKIISQNRRDFRAVYLCEHCGDEHEGRGYDDLNFHENVIPNMVCDKCGKKSDETYRPRVTKYAEGVQV